jgi:hypothetical protein
MITPVLSLNFISSETLNPIITFTRAGATATRINSSGVIETVSANTPRFNYNPATLAALGLLIEESRTNLVFNSSNVLVSNWAQAIYNGGAANFYTATNGATPTPGPGNSNYLIATATPGSIAARQLSLSLSSGVTYTVSAYVYMPTQAGVTSWRMDNNFNGDYAVGTERTTFNAWVRVTNTITLTGTRTQTDFNILVNSGGTTFAGVNFYITNMQVEAGAFATSYIPTTASQVTRTADVATITGTNFSDFWQAGKGGATVLATPSTVSGVRPLVQFDDNTANEIIALRGNAKNPELYIVDGGTSQAKLDTGTNAANTAYSLTGWWATNDCKARKDSGAVVTDTTATIPTVTQMRIGSDGTNYLNGTIATINYYDSFFGRPIYTRRKNKVFPSLL